MAAENQAQNRFQEPTTEDVAFPSADTVSTIHARIWWPAEAIETAGALKSSYDETSNADDTAPQPRGVVQIVHGMSEHVRRYDDFARHLCTRGWIVCGDDHIGHGRSALPGKFGCMPAHGGDVALVEDEHTLRTLMQERVGTYIPYVFFGHSMGSFITRVYLSQHAEGLSGAVICGTGTIPAAKSKAGHVLSRLIAAFRGQDHVSKVLDKLGSGGYDDSSSKSDGESWLSYSKENAAAYRADNECGFAFSAGGYAALTALAAQACSPSCAEAVPHDLPLLYIAGDSDPVGDNGRGVKAAVKLARDAGSIDVTCKIYEHMRHEILNEDDHAYVYEDVANWLERKCH